MGLFVSFEGIDCSGKTTQIEILKEKMTKKKIPALFIREPGSTVIGEKVREILLSPHSSEMFMTAELLLYAAARAQLTREVIKPALNNNRPVFCDRYADSTLAYQGYGAGYDLDIINVINREATGALYPHITFILDIEVEQSLERLQAKKKLAIGVDRIESREIQYFERVRQGYLTIAQSEPERVVLIPGSLGIEEVAALILEKIDRRLSGGI